MSNLTEDELHEMIDKAVQRERERCALLMDMRAEITENSARKVRLSGTFKAQQLTWRWPFFRSVPAVAYKWEEAARDLDAVTRSYRQMAGYIRAGVDPHCAEAGVHFPGRDPTAGEII